MRRILLLSALTLLTASGVGALTTLARIDTTIPPRLLAEPPQAAGANDAIARLNAALDRGSLSLNYREPRGYLDDVLAALEIAPASQTLVFSKTSRQRDLIDDANPRAIYFNEAVAVGWVPAGDVLELTASHPTEGVAFYTLDQRPGSSPRFIRGERCSQCHLLPDSGGTLGLLMMSVLPRLPGDRRPVQGWPVDLRTPVVDRWGGWYVTGKRLPPRHRGTVISAGTAAPIGTGGTPAHAELARYAAPSSDVVALLVLTHQVHVTNAIVRLGRELQASSSTKLSARARVLVTELADALLSTGAAPLTSPVEGALAFVRWFEGQGRRDDQERTLRTLDLSDRLFRYPLSYMIESTAFGNLPAAARAAVYLEVRDRLDRSARNSGLASDERARWQAALEIVRHTQPEFGK